MIVIAISGLVGMVGGFIAGCFDDGPATGIAFALLGLILGGLAGLLLALAIGKVW